MKPETKIDSVQNGIAQTPFGVSQDHWQDYSRRPKPSPVPEAGSYGLLLVALCLCVLVLKRWAAERL